MSLSATTRVRLACPDCGGSLTPPTEAGDGAGEGELTCASCGRCFPIRNGIPRLVPARLAEQQQRTAEAFGWEWGHFDEMHAEFEEQFLDWISPLQPDFFADKVVLDAGCGTGRHAFYAARYGAREVFAIDLSPAVETARRLLAESPNVHVLQADLHKPPFASADGAGVFDFVYSIGVIHHLPDPRAGFDSLTRLVRRGGTLFVWVYGYENNGFVRHVIEPLRRVTTRMPPSLLRGVAWPLAVALHAVVRGVYRPTQGTRLFRLLPGPRDYLASLRQFTFRQNYAIVFDQLVAPSSQYIKREELLEWFEAAGFDLIDISWRNRNSWRGRGRMPDLDP